MYLLALLAIPLVVGVIAMIAGKGELTWKEFLVQEGVILLLIGGGYGLSVGITRWRAAGDVEIWNGRVASKSQMSGSCCHSYPCNPHPCMCDTKGMCSTCWDTCHEHSSDVVWSAVSTNNETIYHNPCNPPGTRTPARWTAITKGEPTSFEHEYVNYIKANPGSILRRTGAANKFSGLIPSYPRVFDHYRVNAFLFMQVKVPGDAKKTLNRKLRDVNADLGARKQLNIIVVVAKTDDLQYVEALRESWLGGKKNDLVVVIGARHFPEFSFVGTVTWSRSEEMRLAIRDRIMEMEIFNGQKILDIIRVEAGKKFVRQPMKEYEYLLANVEPPWWLLSLVFLVGLAVSIVLTVYFVKNDPFDGGGRRYNRFRGFRRRS